MKIAFFTDTYHPQISGVVENVETSAKALRKLGHEVTIVAPRTPGFVTEEKDVFWVPSVKIKKNPELRVVVPLPDSTMRELLSMNFDVIHGHSGGPACFLGWEIARRKRIPYVFTYHTMLARYTHYILNGRIITPKMAEVASRVFCNLCSRVIVPTRPVKRELRSYGVKTKISVIPGGINLDKYTDLKKGFLRSQYGIDQSQTLLLYVGRLGKEKDINFLIKCVANLLKENENVIFCIVGDGPERDKLEKLARDLGIENKIIFTGFVEPTDIPKVYADGDIFLFASQTETQGLVIAEAMSAKLPVLLVKDGAFDNIIFEDKTGLTSKKSSKGFTKKLKDLIKNKKLQAKLGQNAYQLIRKEFSSSIQAERLVGIYQEVVDKKEKAVPRKNLLIVSLRSVNVFLRVNQRFNQFKSAMRFINGNGN